MSKKECIAMLLAGGQGSRLGALTQKIAKPAVSFGGKFRIIDFSLSNCSNSGIDTVGVLTQYRPYLLHAYVGSGEAWDLDSRDGGVSILPPYETQTGGAWYAGTADAITQNLDYIKANDPKYVLILSGDHLYRMDYRKMLKTHIENNADLTVSVMPVPWEEASRFGIMNTGEGNVIEEFEEKPIVAKSNTISCGIYVIRRRLLIEMIERCAMEDRYDFVKDILIRYKNQKRIYGYKIKEYWRNIASVEDYFSTNMDFLQPEIRNYFFKQYPDIYSKVDDLPPAKYNVGAKVSNSLISSGCIVNGTVEDSVIFKKSFVGNNCYIKNSIILNDVYIGDNTHIENCIVESRDTIRANTFYKGEDGIKIVVEKNERYVI